MCPLGLCLDSQFSSALVPLLRLQGVHRSGRVSGGRCIRRASHRPALVPWELVRVCLLQALRGRERVPVRPHVDQDNVMFREV